MEVIRLVSRRLGLGLKEAKNAVDAWGGEVEGYPLRR
jgi:ribosomal protein L7/L12